MEIGSKLIHVYEVKPSADTYSIYCGIGQLMTHSAREPKAKKTIVLPADELAENFRDILSQLGIGILEYKFVEGDVQFLS